MTSSAGGMVFEPVRVHAVDIERKNALVFWDRPRSRSEVRGGLCGVGTWRAACLGLLLLNSGCVCRIPVVPLFLLCQRPCRGFVAGRCDYATCKFSHGLVMEWKALHRRVRTLHEFQHLRVGCACRAMYSSDGLWCVCLCPCHTDSAPLILDSAETDPCRGSYVQVPWQRDCAGWRLGLGSV